MKAASSYASIIGGVSEQPPQDRREGQHHEQVNMISDPVRGLARRHGSLLLSEKVIGNYSASDMTALIAGTASNRTYTFFINGVEYDLIYRSEADSYGLGQLAAFFCVRKDTGQTLDVVLNSDASVNALITGGVSAITNVGRYLYLAGNTITTQWQGTEVWNAPANQRKLAAWVRGSAYNRTYKITLVKTDGTKLTVSYKTKSAGYPGTLDTSDILTSDPDYQKKVNDRVNAFRSEETAWITTAANDVQTSNVATKLRDALVAAGVSASVVSSTVVIDDANYDEIFCDDGGDDTLIRGVGNEVTAAELVSVTHWAGKIVKVRPKRSDGTDAYYLKAVAKDGQSTGWTEVYWQEAAGYVSTPTSLFVMATIKDGTLYIAGSAAALGTLTGETHPNYTPSAVGDLITSPIPTFFGRRIDYLGVFQDRMVVGSGSTIMMSRTGDYLNFFRGSVLTVLDNDPVEVYALGSEGDTIKSSVTFDRNLVMFGKQRQYTMSGRQAVTPNPPPLLVASSDYEDAIDAPPVASGNYTFYCNARDNIRSAVFQVQIGQVADSPESSPISSQLDRYLAGVPVELATVTKPNMLFLRTTNSRNSVYVYNYLDEGGTGRRLFDSWSKWVWSTAVGYQVGMSSYQGTLYVYMIKEGNDSLGSRKLWFSVEQFSLRSDLSDRPYLDSLRLLTNSMTGSINGTSLYQSELFVAFGDTGNVRFLGTSFQSRATFISQYPGAVGTAWAGIEYRAYTTPTNPFMRDRNDKAILNGRLTLTRLLFSLRDTGGCTVTATGSYGTKTLMTFNGRVLGSTGNLIGVQPIVTTQVVATVGKEVREFTYTIWSNKWLPLALTSIEWVGQFFNNTRRA